MLSRMSGGFGFLPPVSDNYCYCMIRKQLVRDLTDQVRYSQTRIITANKQTMPGEPRDRQSLYIISVLSEILIRIEKRMFYPYTTAHRTWNRFP